MKIAAGTCDQDNSNRAMCVAWRRANQDSRNLIEQKFFARNRGCLAKFCVNYGEDFAIAECYLHVPKVLEKFDLTQSRMSVIGYWKQRCFFKLPATYSRESELIPTPLNPQVKEREAIKEFKANCRWTRPDVAIESQNAWETFITQAQQEVEDEK